MFFAHQMVPPDAAADPPIVSAFSMMATDAPFSLARNAAHNPPMPAPATMTS